MTTRRSSKPAKKPDPLEKDIQRQILQHLRLRGHWAMRVNSGAMRATKGDRSYMIRLAPEGTADIIACLKPPSHWIHPVGQFIAIEVKRKGNKPTPLQEAFGRQIEACGGCYLVLDHYSPSELNLWLNSR